LLMRRLSGGRQSRGYLALTLIAVLTATPARAQQNRNWDTNGTSIGNGGFGTWDLTSAVWSPNADGVSGPYSPWNNAGLDNAIFAGTVGTVTLGVPISAHNLTFGTNGYILNGSTLTLGGVTPTITTNAGVAAGINSVITGTAGLTKAGTGNLALSGVNTFSGGINVNGGGLFVNGDAALGDASNGITMANGTGLNSTGALAASRDVTITGGVVTLSGAGVGSAHFTGAGGVNVSNGVTMSNDANDYLGRTAFTSGSETFTSIADLGVASSLGAPTTVVNGTIAVSSGGGVPTTVSYVGDGDSSNRNWNIFAAGAPAPVVIRNQGTGTLTLTGNFNLGGAGLGAAVFQANAADIELLGVLSGVPDPVVYQGTGPARTITLGGANTYTNTTSITNVTVRAPVLADSGVASSLGAGAVTIGVSNVGVLSYTGAGASSNRNWSINNGTLRNDGTGALILGGNLSMANTVRSAAASRAPTMSGPASSPAPATCAALATVTGC